MTGKVEPQYEDVLIVLLIEWVSLTSRRSEESYQGPELVDPNSQKDQLVWNWIHVIDIVGNNHKDDCDQLMVG